MKSDPQKALTMEKSKEIGRSCACFNLRKAARAITQLYDENLRPTGLTGAQFTLLMAARGVGPVPISKLAKGAVLDRTTLTRNLKVLEKKELIRIETGLDRRAREVSLTDLGHEALSKAIPLWAKAQARVKEGLGEEGMNRLLKYLSEIVSLARRG
jgi:DNA-binding MarR family transcriptional regulator